MMALRTRTLVFWFAAGLLLRLVILTQTAGLGPAIADELQYSELASSLLHGRGFAWATGERTSLRPPLYPALVAATWRVTGDQNYHAIRVLQLVLSLLTAVAVYAIGREVSGAPAGRIAALATWLYPSLIYASTSLLTETLFTLLLVTFVWLAIVLVRRPSPAVAFACGLALGLGALTRSVLWPVPILLCPLLALLLWRRSTSGMSRASATHPPDRAIDTRAAGMPAWVLAPVVVFAGYALVVAPWAVRNTRLQHVPTVVDTMGGMNLRMGNYEYTPEDRIWDAVSLKGEKNWVYALTQEPAGPPPPGGVFTEGMKDKWAQRKAIGYMRTHPGTTLRRAAIKFGDFWGLERSFVAGVQEGLYAPPRWFAVAAAVTIVLTYVVLVSVGTIGFWLAPMDWRSRIVLALPVVLICGVHSIVFGHERYHLPLIPLFAVMSGALLSAGWRRWATGRPMPTAGAVLCLLLLAGIWARQILVTDAARLRGLIDRLF